jgi:EAL domain
VFGAQAMRLDADGTIRRGRAAYPANDPPVAFEVDRAVLQHALKGARRLVRRDERALVTVPLRRQSLLDHSAGQIVDLLRAQRPAVRRLVVIEVTELLAEAPTARLGEAIAPLQPFCRSIIASVPPGFVEVERAARLGLASVGLDLADTAADATIAQLAGFATGAHAQGMTAHIQGIPDRATFEAARAAGFDFLNSPAVIAEAVRPVAMHPFAEPEDA